MDKQELGKSATHLVNLLVALSDSKATMSLYAKIGLILERDRLCAALVQAGYAPSAETKRLVAARVLALGQEFPGEFPSFEQIADSLIPYEEAAAQIQKEGKDDHDSKHQSGLRTDAVQYW